MLGNHQKGRDSTAHLNPVEGLRVRDRGCVWLVVPHVPQNTAVRLETPNGSSMDAVVDF